MATASGTPRRPPTLSDVARLAGVSVATASKSLNGRHQVKAETRERVISAAEQLNFSPNVLARNLLSGRSGAIGLVTHDLEGRFSIPTLMGAEDAAGTGKVSVLLCDARGDALREQYHVQALLGRRVDGLMIVGARPDPRPSLGPLPVPVVYAYAPSEDPADMSVVSDNVLGGRVVAEHLIACGRSRIAVVTGDATYGAAHDRVAGVRAVLDGAGVGLTGEPLYGSWSEEWGRAATALVLAQHPDVDAIVCGSDQIARGVLDQLRESGRRVPEDVAVTGHDNWEILALNARPHLTSVDMNLEELGRRAAALLFDAIDGQVRPGTDVVPCRLVPRGSTGPRVD
ncbi:LacI family transcriptional regulator [Cellulomonas hominis]|uniref:LacI family transcriptional regulator n=1 Tax=Cellulomonas hominis TaxID=156981 RepID=A0A511F7T4_9CELL|nr:LacI family DNA-binding transcriptional regulator [Cellulomonas hominis]MBB5473383.1 LacI family transcriptional regulator [Cellulomonas hominis]NKY06208.1 LacI family transcriptional regulator [Cellulomonas hominis]GEL45332.1 LacI family transcriptional regulator [Cellulomonas hominis]